MNQKVTTDMVKGKQKPALLMGWLFLIFSSLFLFTGCGNNRLASVEERQTKSNQASVNSDNDYSAVDHNIRTYSIQAGDTLYSIAFRFGLDYQTLAKTNNIDSNYLIRIGQKLDIEAARNYKEQPSPNIEVAKVPRANTEGQVIRRTPQQKNAKGNAIKPRVKVVKPKPVTREVVKVDKTKKPSNKTKTTNTKTRSKPNSAVKKPSNKENYSNSNNAVKFWIWPNMGKISKTFRSTGNKGIDILGNVGDPVRASAAGRVVYAGRGLRGYGNLIIIKHNNQFISAYAHNKRLLVKESEIIKAGQKIAEIGNSDTDLPKLHFEIRYKGKPTDPMKYLPKR